MKIIDRRTKSRDRSSENRQRFIRRVKGAIREQLDALINSRNIKDLDADGTQVYVNGSTVEEPSIVYGEMPKVVVTSGNNKYVEGDIIDKHRSGGGGRGNGAGRGHGDLEIDLTKHELLDIFFEDLALPNLRDSDIARIKDVERENTGFQISGSPNRLSLLRSYRHSLMRRKQLSAPYKRYLLELEQLAVAADLEPPTSFDQLPSTISLTSKKAPGKFPASIEKPSSAAELREIVAELINKVRAKLASFPIFEKLDLRYKTSVARTKFSKNATMVMIIDSSGSMGMREKTMARKFFWLLYRFLKLEYEEVNLIFVMHDDEAMIVSEEEFFEQSIGGGTTVSSALVLTKEMLRRELANDKNVYVAQVSDGDNDPGDNETCEELLRDDILPRVNYFAYIQVLRARGSGYGGLWDSYNKVSKVNPKLQAKAVYEDRDIFAVFKELFAANPDKG